MHTSFRARAALCLSLQSASVCRTVCCRLGGRSFSHIYLFAASTTTTSTMPVTRSRAQKTAPTTAMAPPRNSDPQGLAEPVMLEKIDKLFACGVGELVDLPQIVVVGDQSSGKSSVLEGLIQKPLPRDAGLHSLRHPDCISQGNPAASSRFHHS